MDQNNEPPMEPKCGSPENSSLAPTNELLPTSDPALAAVACSQDLGLFWFFKTLGFALLSALPSVSPASSTTWELGKGAGRGIHEVSAMDYELELGSSFLPLNT